MLCAKYDWNWPTGSGEEDFFLKLVNLFTLFCNYPPLEKGGLLLWTNLNPLHPRMICAKFGWNDFSNLSMFIYYFKIISPWKRTGPFMWTNLNPLHPRMICAKICWNMNKWLWRRFLNFVNAFLLFRNYPPSKKGHGPSFEQTWAPFTQKCFEPSLVEISPLVLEKKIF